MHVCIPNTEILIGQCKYIIMSNTLYFLQDIFLDDEKYFIISKCIKDEPDKFDQKFFLESINFYEKHKHDINSTV